MSEATADVEAVVRGLTKASVRALARIPRWGWIEEGAPGPARVDAYSLWWGRDGKKGLVERPVAFKFGSSGIPGYRYALSDRGRTIQNSDAFRARLLSETANEPR